ncbi:MAG: mannosyltransferase family protein [Candidatus Daviesbacteria bacterium]|nr:mannosyltransferase family protein [Candidatus Daviesbacteria bacterium]
MKKLLLTDNLKNILLLFLGWKLLLLLAFFLSFQFPLAGKNFLGGGLQNYLNQSWLFAWANFDGEHYLSIAQFGYRNLEQAFFPVYPSLMHFFTNPFGVNITSLTISGLLISNISFVLSLILLAKLLEIDYKKNIVYLTVILLLIYPTAFYFGALYSESIFLLFSLAAFYSARQKKWQLATIFGILASATRVFGFLLLPAIFFEAWQQKEKIKNYFWIIFIPLGLFAYMYYLYLTTGDPIAFYSLQKNVGEQHQSGVTLLPQVYFRYLKILFSVDPSNPIYPTMILEFFTGILFFILPIYGYFKKVRWSYLFYGLVGFLLPTIQGSFSSVPRYVVVFFPAFLVLAIFLESRKNIKYLWLAISVLWLILETSLFLRGYWIA